MKKLLTILGVVGLLGLLTTAAMAANDTEYVTVSVEEIEALDVLGSTSVVLNATTAGTDTYTQGTAKDSSGLKYSHNSTTPKKITAVAVADGEKDNDITLTVAVADGEAQTLVIEGADIAAGAVVWTDIDAGGYTTDLIWTADGTLAGTPPGNYGWSVTFTSADA